MAEIVNNIYDNNAKNGDLPVFTGKFLGILRNGAAGQILTSNGPNNKPTWEDNTSGFITEVNNTPTINLDVTGGQLTADFASMDISQFTNNSGYFVNGGALSNGTTATTQSVGDNSTKVATTAYVDRINTYTLTAYSASFSPADATTYKIGSVYTAIPGTSSTGNRRIYIPSNATIRAAYVHFFIQSTLGSSETSSIYILLNNSTATLISNSLIANVGAASNTSLNIPVVAGDYIEIQWDTPTWATNPTGVFINAVIYLN